jgi:hypothetical protein
MVGVVDVIWFGVGLLVGEKFENERAAMETGGRWSPWRPVMSPACAWACRAAGRAGCLGKGRKCTDVQFSRTSVSDSV